MVKLTEADLGALYREATQPPSREGCPDAETLAAALDGAADPATLEHVASCSACAEELQLLAPPRAPNVVAMPRPPRWIHAMAAMLAVAVVGLGIINYWLWRHPPQRVVTIVRTVPVPDAANGNAAQIAELERQLRVLTQPQLNVPIIDLEGAVRGGAEAKVIELSPSATFFDLVLNVSDPRNYTNYGLELRDARQQLVWEGEGLRRSGYDTFTLALPTRLLPAGRYSLRLFTAMGGTRKTVEEYMVEIRYR